MKQTGVIRKVDELGRIVLPKEIRRNLGIKDGESLEIYVDEQGIYLQKFSKLLDLKEMSKNLCQLILDIFSLDMIIIDRDKVIASSIKEIIGNKIPNKIEKLLENREKYESNNKENFYENLDGFYIMNPLIISADCIGVIIFYKKSNFTIFEKQLLNFVNQLFILKIEI